MEQKWEAERQHKKLRDNTPAEPLYRLHKWHQMWHGENFLELVQLACMPILLRRFG